MAGGWWGAHRWRPAAAVGLVLLLLIGMGLQADAWSLHRQAEGSDQATAELRQRESDIATSADVMSGQLDSARTDAAAAASALANVRAVLEAAGTSEAALAGDVAAAHAGLADLQAQIAAMNTAASTKGSEFDQLRGCLDVAQRALDSVAVRSSGRVDADLASASQACSSSATAATTP